MLQFNSLVKLKSIIRILTISLFFEEKIKANIFYACRRNASKQSRVLQMCAVYSSHLVHLIYWPLDLLTTEFAVMIFVIPGFPGVL